LSRASVLRSAVLAASVVLAVTGCSLKSPSSSSDSAADDFPQRAIHLQSVVPAGSVFDVYARALADASASCKCFDQPVVVDDLAGSGSPGVVQVLSAANDGYTMGIASMSHLLAQPVLNPGLPYKNANDYEPVMDAVSVYDSLAVPANSPYKSIEDLVAAGKANPGKIRYGAGGGLGSLPQLVMVQLEQATGAKYTVVPFASSALGIAALLGGQIDAIVATTADLSQHAKAGTMRVLGTFAPERDTGFDNVPTFKEKGIDVTLSSFYILFAPKGTPAAIVDKLYQGFKKASETPTFKAFADKSGYKVLDLKDPAATRTMLLERGQQVEKLLTDLNLAGSAKK